VRKLAADGRSYVEEKGDGALGLGFGGLKKKPESEKRESWKNRPWRKKKNLTRGGRLRANNLIARSRWCWERERNFEKYGEEELTKAYSPELGASEEKGCEGAEDQPR